MSWSAYTVTLHSPYGLPVDSFTDIISLDYARSVNNVGACTLVVPYTDWRWQVAIPDAILDIWRTNGVQPKRPLDTVWLLRKRQKTLAEDGSRTLTLTFVDLMDLPARRVIAYLDTSAKANRSGPLETVLKDLVTDNLLTVDYVAYPAAGDQDCLHQHGQSLAKYIAMEGDAGRGPNVTDASPLGNVLQSMQTLAQAAFQTHGTYVAFDFEVQDVLRYVFRVYVGMRGSDRSLSGVRPVVVSPEGGMLGTLDYEEDYSAAPSYVIMVGAGTNTPDDPIQYAVWPASGTPSPYVVGPLAYLEAVGSATNTATGDALYTMAAAAARDLRPVTNFSASLRQTPGFQFGRDFDFGDKLTCQFDGVLLPVRVDAIQVTVSGADGSETINAELRPDLNPNLPGAWL